MATRLSEQLEAREIHLVKILPVLFSGAMLIYPVAVYFGAGKLPPFAIGAVLVSILLARGLLMRDRLWIAAAFGAAVLTMASALGGGWYSIRLYPVLVNAVMLGVFGFSLFRGPTVIARFAAMGVSTPLPAATVDYARKVTQVWCLFFIVNGTIALATTFWASPAVWLFYNGFLAYVLMGALFLVEWLVRRRVIANRNSAEAGV